MQTPNAPNYYLRRGFDEQYSDYGVPYVAESCSINPASDNITIYGHHMKSGKLFGALDGYTDYAFWQKHPTIRFDTRAGFAEYAVMARVPYLS
jgi:sortase B